MDIGRAVNVLRDERFVCGDGALRQTDDSWGDRERDGEIVPLPQKAGYGGLGQEDWEARHLLRQALVLIEERWPGMYPRQTSDLASLCELIEHEGRGRA